jgi:pimeloyl-ACP methyl ester carboxylesterase
VSSADPSVGGSATELGAPEAVAFRGLTGALAGDRWEAQTDGGAPKGVVLMLHGGGQTRHSWRAAGATLAARGWTTYALDARGHGESDWDPDGNYGFRALAGDLRAVIAQIGEKPVIVGASMGGLTSIIAEGETGNVARALVLVDITPRVEPAGVERIQKFMLSAPNGFDTLEEVAEAISAYQPNRPRRTNLEGLRKNVRRGPNGRWFWHWDPAFIAPRADEYIPAVNHDEIAAAAARIRVPTLLVRGEDSDVVGDAGVAELRALIPDSRYLTVPKAGHMVAGDDNASFLTGAGDFLDEVAAR